MPVIDVTRRNRIAGNSPRKLTFDTLCEHLTAIARDLGAGEKMPTISELCSLTGVSVKTLDRALNELQVRKLIVRRNGVGIFVSELIDKKILSMVCDPLFFRAGGASSFWETLIDQMRLRAMSHSEVLDLHFMAIEGDELCVPPSLKLDIGAGRVAGVLAVGTFIEAVEWIENEGTPVVVFAGPGTYRTTLDMGAVIQKGAATLAAQGCQRVALLTPQSRDIIVDPVNVDRPRTVNAFARGLSEHGVPLIDELLRLGKVTVTTGPWSMDIKSQELGYLTTLSLFRGQRETWPDGIVVAEDNMCVGVFAAMQELGIRPGTDVKIATHANKGSAKLAGWTSVVTQLEIDPSSIVTAMFSQLDRLIAHDRTVEHEVRVAPAIVPPAVINVTVSAFSIR